MEIVGRIILALPEMTGTSKAGNPWKKREYVLETQENYPKRVHFDFFGDRADQYPLQVGQVVRLYFDIESREYNGRWFTSIRGWKAEDPSQAASQPAPGQSAEAAVYGAPAQTAFAPAQAPFPGAPAGYGQPAPGAVPPPPVPTQDAPDDLPF